jgi:hypothetical protein
MRERLRRVPTARAGGDAEPDGNALLQLVARGDEAAFAKLYDL